MSTLLQKNLAKEIVKNSSRKRPLNKKELVVLGGYSETVAVAKPQVIMEQAGVQDELKTLGFTEENAKSVVVEIMQNAEVDASARLKATDQVFKVKGTYAPEKSTALQVNLNAQIVANSELEALRVEYEEKLKAKQIDENII